MSKLFECYTIIWYKMQTHGSMHEYAFKKYIIKIVANIVQACSPVQRAAIDREA